MLRLLLIALTSCWMATVALGQDAPRSLDPKIAVRLFAEQPQIVTPTGIDVDESGRVWAIESNTHFPPEGYKGHPTDRLLVLSDADTDGKAEVAVFADGFTHAMSVAVPRSWMVGDPSNESTPNPYRVFVATRREILQLIDDDRDGKADSRSTLVRLETAGNYPHNGLAGFAFDAMGWMYFGFGENLGASYKIIGSDGGSLSGGGEGGNIYRCRIDGSKLSQVATGFWNPHANCVDAFGRLFSVDNDPDSRPPCRLLHVIPEGDYGYRFRNGRKGLHPFSAWDGEIPGTLPMVAGTGEAPSGIVAYESDGLPEEYRGQLFVTSWGDHRIDRFKLVPRGASFQSLAEPLITGGEDFRPVGLAVAPDGSLYCTDWVKKDYKVHGYGRIWKISATESKKRSIANVLKISAGQPASELAPLLEAPRLDVRRTAARSLAATGEGRKLLVAALKDGKRTERVRLESLWALAAVAPSDGKRENVLETGVLSKKDAVSTAAAWLIGQPGFTLDDAGVRKQLNDLLGLLLSDDVDIPFDRGLSLPLLAKVEWNDGDRLVSAALSVPDPFVVATMVPVMAKRLSADELSKFLNPGSGAAPEIARAMVLAARRKDPKDVGIVTTAVGNADPDVKRLAVQWIAEEKLTSQRTHLEAVLNKGNVTSELLLATLAGLELLDGVNPAEFDKTPASKYVLSILKDAKRPPALHAQVLRLVSPTAPELTADLLKGFLASADPKLRLETVRTLQTSMLPEAPALLRELAASDKESPVVRSEAAVGLAFALGRVSDDDTRLSVQKLLQSSDAILRADGLRAVRGIAVKDDELRAAAAKAAAALPEAGTRTTEADRELAEQIALALLGTKEPLPERVAKLKPKRPATKADWMATLAKGRAVDVEAGRRVFYHPNGPGCFKCHTIDGRGGKVGPDLTKVVRTANRPQIIESILEPSREIAPQFVAWALTMKDGKVHTGMIVQENEGRLLLGNAEGATLDLKTADVEERTPQKVSVMPEKLADRMTLQEFRDLLAFLDSLK